MRHYERLKPKRRPILPQLFGILLLTSGLTLFAWQTIVRTSYQHLAEASAPLPAHDSTSHQAQSPQEQTRDWKSLQAQNEDIVAWISIEGTSIDLPVVASNSKPTDYYLAHDFWCRWALEGTPYLDSRCQPTDTHRLIYGHHLATGGQFSDLQKAYDPTAFTQIGPCHWYTPTNNHKTLSPFCSLQVDMSYQPIQTLDFNGTEELQAWLTSLASSASARTPDWQQRVSNAQSVITLVTCSSDFAGQSYRTLVVFIEDAPRCPS